MARRARRDIVVPGRPHHITFRGNNRRRLFSYPDDYRALIRLLRSGLRKTDCAMHSGALLANHGHLLITPATVEDLSRLMKHVNQRYAARRNKKKHSSGKLFEERYFAEPFKDENHLITGLLYIETNRARAGLCDTAIEQRWTTYQLHAGQGSSDIPPDLWTPLPWFESPGDGADRAQRYRELLDAYLTAKNFAPPFEEVGRIEALALEHYRARVERPDGSSARESRSANYAVTRKSRANSVC